MFGRLNFRNIVELFAFALLIGLYGLVITFVPNARLRYTLLFCLVLVFVIAGPMYLFLRHKKRVLWPTLFMRVLLVATFVVTGMPIVTAAGLVFGAMGIASGFSLLYEGQVLRGLLVAVVWVFAFYGLVTLWSLAKHFWKEPSRNPTGAQLKRNIIGLVMGLLAVPALWMPTVVGKGSIDSMAGLGALFTIPSALFFVSLLGWNRLREEKISTIASPRDDPS